MLNAKYRRIFYFHLKKCGGSTLNRWLDTLTSDLRTFNGPDWRGFTTVDASSAQTGWGADKIVPSFARTAFHWSDVIHSHSPVRMYAPEDTFCFTVLRDPVERLISQVADLRRLDQAATVRSPPMVREFVADCGRLPPRDFLEKHAMTGGRRLLDNYLTRSLAAGRVGDLIDCQTDPESLCEMALHGLETDYDMIGLTEDMDLSRNAVCAMTGLPPARKIPTVNATPFSDRLDKELEGLDDILHHLTHVDRVLYDRARQLFDRRNRHTAETYDTAAFETHHAGRLLGEAEDLHLMVQPAFRCGRQSSARDFTDVTAPDCRSARFGVARPLPTTLYIPVPPNMKLSLLVWIRGYADIAQRHQLRVKVDERPAAHHFDYADGYADLLTIDACPAKDFVPARN